MFVRMVVVVVERKERLMFLEVLARNKSENQFVLEHSFGDLAARLRVTSMLYQ